MAARHASKKRHASSSGQESDDGSSGGGLKTFIPWIVLVGAATIVTAFALDLGAPAPTPARPAPAQPSTPLASTQPTNRPVTTAPAAPAPSPTAKANFTVSPAVLDYGTLAPGEVKPIDATVTNTGDEPLRFTGEMKGCSCTTLDLRPTTVQPGESVTFTATMTAGLTPTTKKSSIRLVLRDHQPARIEVDGEIVRGVRVNPRRLAAVGRPADNSDGPAVPVQVRRVRFESPSGTPFRILRVDGRDVKTFIGGDRFLNPQPTHAFIFDDFEQWDPVTGLNDKGELMPFFRMIETDHPGGEVIAIPVDHPARVAHLERRGERPWLWVETHLVVGAVEPGGTIAFDVPIKMAGANEAEMVHGVTSESPDVLDVTLAGIRREGREWRATINVTPKRTDDGAFLGRIRFHSPNYSASVPVIGAVRTTGA